MVNMEMAYENQGFDNNPSESNLSLAMDSDDPVKSRMQPLRKITNEDFRSRLERKRNEHLQNCRCTADMFATDGQLIQLDTLLRDKSFSENFFGLFDGQGQNQLEQDEWFEQLKMNMSGSFLSHLSSQAREDILSLIETAAYIICEENPITQEYFYKIINSRNVPGRIFRLADCNSDGQLSVAELSDFLVTISTPRFKDNFSPEQMSRLQSIFEKNLPWNKKELSLQEFKKIMPSKNAFFVERVFKIFDKDGDNMISWAEFCDTMYNYAANETSSEKVLFLFKVYDIDGDNKLQLEELEQIMNECLRESGLEIPEIDVQALALALYEEALGGDMDTGEINIDQLRAALEKNEGLLENLTISLAKWIVPSADDLCKKPKRKGILNYWRKQLSAKRLQNQLQLKVGLAVILIINAALFIARAYYFKDFANLDDSYPNPYYLLSRANGRTLLFNSTLILVFVTRYTITKLRELGFSTFLPLDHNIYIHKFIGVLIFFQAWIHTIMHFCNFAINVQPDPVKFAQINNDFWSVTKYEEYEPNWVHLGYNIPPGCYLSLNGSNCSESSLSSFRNVTACQICPDGEPWNIGEWLFLMRPGVFGLVGGLANPTGAALIIITTIMTICSMPFVRKSGNFEVFYFTHLLYWPYFILLILHCPDFWKWVIGPLLIYLIERIYRFLSITVGQGSTQILDMDVLPSRVTKLVIQRPDGFKFCPGDWVFVCIPTIAKHEWHPFTISSAPERRESFTVHIRGVGQWTNKLYEFVDQKKKQEGISSRRVSRKSKRGNSQRYKDLTSLRSITGDLDGKGHLNEVVVASACIKSDKKEKFGSETLSVMVDGPFGAPASNIFRAEHAVLIATGIGVTPFSSILQSIMHRHFEAQRECPNCRHKWSDDFGETMLNLRKVTFFWINRDQKSFEWFIELLSDMESAQMELDDTKDGFKEKGRLLDFHLYFTAALQRTDMRAVGLHLAMDLLHRKEKKDLLTGLQAKTNAGRPNWNKVFQQLKDKNHGKITVFYCGNPLLAKTLREKCEDFGFGFRKEVF